MKTRYSRKFYPAVLLLITAISSAQAQWQWSDALQTYTYRDNDGRIHYADGSVGPVTTVAVDSQGRAVYSANSAGPADKTGKYAIQAARIDESSIGPAHTFAYKLHSQLLFFIFISKKKIKTEIPEDINLATHLYDLSC